MKQGGDGGALDRACAYIAFHYHEPIRLHMLATRIANTSAGHLARLVRENKRLSFTEYLRDIRLQKAAETLRNTKLPISRIAKSVGYLDGSRFALHFRKRFGMTPIAYRRTHVRAVGRQRPVSPGPSGVARDHGVRDRRCHSRPDPGNGIFVHCGGHAMSRSSSPPRVLVMHPIGASYFLSDRFRSTCRSWR
ncbi:MAG: helix-turn-helix transcriptional regulator [Sedimentisphaerales bacterium]|nr:helix-turn-helix transcriptional regulator [Sedimentisphaerales bacterium]